MADRKLVILLLILIFFGIFARVLSLNNDFSGEEVDFVKPAIAVSKIARPLFYQCEQQPLTLSLWHPPMYVFLLGLIFKVFIINEVSARIVNVLFSLFGALLIYIFCLKIIGGEKGKIIGLISTAFFLINYYVLSSSLLIDIDVLSTFFVFLFIYSFLRYSQTKSGYYLILSSVAFFFSLANRYPIALIVFFFIGVYYYFNKELRGDFYHYLLCGGAAGIFFLAIWSFYSIAIEPGTFFYFIAHNFSLGSSQFSSMGLYIGSFFLNISQFIRLVTLPGVILIFLSFIYSLKMQSKMVKILLIYTLSILIFFFMVPRPAFGYPRYFLTAFPGISILISIFIYQNLKNFKLDGKRIMIVFLSFVLSLLLLFVLSPQLTVYSSSGLIKATNLPDFIFNLFGSLPLFFVLLEKEGRNKLTILILIALFLSYSFYFGVGYVLHDTKNRETGIYLKENTNETEVLLVSKAIGYYTGRKFYANDFKKPLIDNLSRGYFFEYLKKSYETRGMNDPFFWGEFYGGASLDFYNPTPEELEKVSYVVLAYESSEARYEERIGEFYVYNVQ